MKKATKMLIFVLTAIFSSTALADVSEAGWGAEIKGIGVSPTESTLGEEVTMSCRVKNLTTNTDYDGWATFYIFFSVVLTNEGLVFEKNIRRELGPYETDTFTMNYGPSKSGDYAFACEVMNVPKDYSFDWVYVDFTVNDPHECEPIALEGWHYYCDGDRILKNKEMCYTYYDGSRCKIDYNDCRYDLGSLHVETCVYGCQDGKCVEGPNTETQHSELDIEIVEHTFPKILFLNKEIYGKITIKNTGGKKYQIDKIKIESTDDNVEIRYPNSATSDDFTLSAGEEKTVDSTFIFAIEGVENGVTTMSMGVYVRLEKENGYVYIGNIDFEIAKECSLKSVSWDYSQLPASRKINDSGLIDVVIKTSGYCKGKRATIDFFEDDIVRDDIIYPSNTLYLDKEESDATYRSTWTAKFTNDVLDSYPEVYAKVTLDDQTKQTTNITITPIQLSLGNLQDFLNDYYEGQPPCEDYGENTISEYCRNILTEEDEQPIEEYETTLEDIIDAAPEATIVWLISACETCVPGVTTTALVAIRLCPAALLSPLPVVDEAVSCIGAPILFGVCGGICGGAVADSISAVIPKISSWIWFRAAQKEIERLPQEGLEFLSKKETLTGVRIIARRLSNEKRVVIENRFRLKNPLKIQREVYEGIIWAYDGGWDFLAFRKSVRYIEPVHQFLPREQEYIAGLFKKGFRNDFEAGEKMAKGIFSPKDMVNAIRFDKGQGKYRGSFKVTFEKGKFVRRIHLYIDTSPLGNFEPEFILRRLTLKHEQSHSIGMASLERFYPFSLADDGKTVVTPLNLRNGAMDYFDDIASIRSLNSKHREDYKDVLHEWLLDQYFSNENIWIANAKDDYWLANFYNLAEEFDDTVLMNMMRDRLEQKFGSSKWFVRIAEELHDDAEIYARERLWISPSKDFHQAIEKWLLGKGASGAYPMTYDYPDEQEQLEDIGEEENNDEIDTPDAEEKIDDDIDDDDEEQQYPRYNSYHRDSESSELAEDEYGCSCRLR